MRKRQKRGFLVALLIGFDEKKIHTWKVYSHSLKEHKILKLPRKWKYFDDKQIYNLLEVLVNLIRPVVKEGLKSILLACEEKKDYASDFLEHIDKHHRWLIKGYNQVSFGKIIGLANSLESAQYLISQEDIIEIVEDTINEELNQFIAKLEKLIGVGDPNELLIYNLEEIEKLIYKGGKKDKSVADEIDIIIITENFLKNYKNKNRVSRLIQIANNKGIKTKIISTESSAVTRFDQFGGIIVFKKSTS